MIHLHIMGGTGPEPLVPSHLADALRSIAHDIEIGALSGESVVYSWLGREDVTLGRPIVTPHGLTRYVDWSLTRGDGHG